MPKSILIAAAWIGIEIALISFASAQTRNHVATIFDAGVAAYDAGHFDRAYLLWKSIEDKDIAAMRNLGILLRKGQGVKKDPAAAEELFERAARAGLVTAQVDLADMLLKGEAGPPNANRALLLLAHAAAAKYPVAQFQLAQMYEAGKLVPKDINTARNLYADAAKHGIRQAQDRLTALGPVAPRPPTAVALPAITAAALKASMAAEPTTKMTIGTATDRAEMLQIGSYKSLAATGAAWKSAQSKYASLLLGRFSNVQRVNLGERGTWYRLRVAGFRDRIAASALCDRLKKAGGKCLLTK